MELSDQTLENKWVTLKKVKPSEGVRERLRDSGAMDAMWKWLPRLAGQGMTFDSYYNHVAALTKSGAMIPFWAFRKSDGEFAGGAAFLRARRTHRSVQIGYMWTPQELRGTEVALAVQAAMLRAACDWRAKRVYWIVDTQNEAMTRFMERKVCAKKEGVFQAYARMNDGHWCDAAIYALVGDEIDETIERLEAVLESDAGPGD